MLALLLPVDDRLVSAKAETHSEKECVGEVIDGHCYQFNPTLMTFSEAEVKYTPSQSYSHFSETNSSPNICVCVCIQSSCSILSPHGHLASVTNGDLHSRLVSMVIRATKSPVLTWLGGVVKVSIPSPPHSCSIRMSNSNQAIFQEF